MSVSLLNEHACFIGCFGGHRCKWDFSKECITYFHRKEILTMVLKTVKNMLCRLQAIFKIFKDNKNKLFWTTYPQGKNNHSCWHHSDRQHHSSRELNHNHSFLFHSTGLKNLQRKQDKLWFSSSLCVLLTWNFYSKCCSVIKTKRCYDPYSPEKGSWKSELLCFIYKELKFTHFLFNITYTCFYCWNKAINEVGNTSRK